MLDIPPAILGGPPTFTEPVAFMRPTLPSFESIEGATREAFVSGMLTKGAKLREFETAIAEHLGVKHAIGVSSCTTGLMLTYQGLDLQGDVVVPSFTFMATVSSLVWAGVRPVFADVDLASGTLSVEAAEKAITDRTTAIVAVHAFGNPADIAGLKILAERRGLKLIFDAAHGFGARYGGQPVGSQGSAQVFSLSPTKLLVAGEGGIVATNDDQLAEHIRIGREYGNDGAYDSLFAGMNARLSEFNAILGVQSLRLLEQVAESRNRIAEIYRSELARTPGIRFMRVREGDRCSYKDLSIVVDSGKFGLSRDELASCLAEERIDTRKYYSPTVHRHVAYRHFSASEVSFPNTNALADNSLSLPMFTQLSESSVKLIAGAIQRLHRRAADVRAAFEGRVEVSQPSVNCPSTQSSLAETL